MAKTVLLIAFHIPPSAISSGHLRPLGFAKYLPSLGWTPAVLSASTRAYSHTDAASVKLVPEGCPVYRAFALDAGRHLSIRGKYPAVLAQPDRWASWWPAAVGLGLRLVRRHKVQAIWSTYPIMTAHCVAHTLSRLTNLPWIADFRDPVTSSVAERDRLTRSSRMRCERRILSRANYSVFTTPGAMHSYAERYPGIHREGRLKVIQNGFDEADFAALPPYRSFTGGRSLHLVHAGVLYPTGRSPIPFFEALASLRDSGFFIGRDLRVTLRASGSERQYGVALERLGLQEMVSLAPGVPYHEALAEQAQADGLLLFQGDQYDNQIPAKLYEYLRIGRPIFALVGGQGDTAAVLREAGGAELVPLDDVSRIKQGFVRFVMSLIEGEVMPEHQCDIGKWSRRQGAVELAHLLDQVVGRGARAETVRVDEEASRTGHSSATQ